MKKPIATIKNLNAKAAKGSLLSTIGFVVTKAEDHNKTKIRGKNLFIYLVNLYDFHVKPQKNLELKILLIFQSITTFGMFYINSSISN